MKRSTYFIYSLVIFLAACNGAGSGEKIPGTMDSVHSTMDTIKDSAGRKIDTSQAYLPTDTNKYKRKPDSVKVQRAP